VTVVLDLARLETAAQSDFGIAWRMQFQKLTVGIKVDDEDSHTLTIGPGVVAVSRTSSDTQDITLAGSSNAWAEFSSSHPAPGFQSLASMLDQGHLELQGDILVFSRHSMMLERLFARLRDPKPNTAATYDEPEIEEVVGRYVRMTMNGRSCRVYYEEAGSGVPLLCLHTAGSDGRQYRALMNDPEITRNFRVIAFDLPWHGKSAPPAEFQNEVYALTTDGYVASVMDFCSALKLQNPVVMGCSIGGRAVLHLALRHGSQFRAGIGLQSADHAESKLSEKYNLGEKHTLFRPDTHGGDVSAASVMAVMSPTSPSHHEWETLWYYMQGGPGVFMGDLSYYFVDGDMRNGLIDGINPDVFPLYFLTGEYDLSATPEMTRELAKAVSARHCETMKGVGHFPMSEDPATFREYLIPVLEKVLKETAS
jgi:pimeloyl-ACP methyl ester carboxylesterase